MFMSRERWRGLGDLLFVSATEQQIPRAAKTTYGRLYQSGGCARDDSAQIIADHNTNAANNEAKYAIFEEHQSSVLSVSSVFNFEEAYCSMPCWATAMLSRVEFLTMYIISSAWRMISWALFASSG